jgi:hypothetical protein
MIKIVSKDIEKIESWHTVARKAEGRRWLPEEGGRNGKRLLKVYKVSVGRNKVFGIA